MEAAKFVKGGSGEPNRVKNRFSNLEQVKKIAEDKMADLNCFTMDSAIINGCRRLQDLWD